MNYALKPYVLALRVTERCNVGCFHCAISATPHGADMTYTRAVCAIEQAAAWGIRLLHVSGGEPLLCSNLAAIVREGRNMGMFVEMVSSTVSTPDHEADDLGLLRAAAEAGLGRVLLSYDDGHARRVELKRFLRFVVAAQDLGLEICVYGLKGSDCAIKVEQIQNAFGATGIPVEMVDWVAGMYSHAGRGAVIQPTALDRSFARCPYVLPVPTLAPDGRVLLCPCAVLSAPGFVLGHQDIAGLGVVLDRFQHSRFYRFLALHGPHKALRKLGKSEGAIPVDMCTACNEYLMIDETSISDLLCKTDLDDVTVAHEALLPPHKRFLDRYHGIAPLTC